MQNIFTKTMPLYRVESFYWHVVKMTKNLRPTLVNPIMVNLPLNNLIKRLPSFAPVLLRNS